MQARVNEHEHEREEHEGEVHLGRLQHHCQGAEFLGTRQAERDDNVAEDVEQSASNDKEEHIAIDQVRRDHDLHIADNYKRAEDELTAHEYATESTVVIGREIVKREVGQEEDQRTLPERIKDPSPEDIFVEVDVLEANSVQARPSEDDLLRILVVHSREPNDRQGREEEIEGDVEETIVDLGACEERKRPEHKDGHRLEDILVEHVADSVGVPAVSLPAMEE